MVNFFLQELVLRRLLCESPSANAAIHVKQVKLKWCLSFIVVTWSVLFVSLSKLCCRPGGNKAPGKLFLAEEPLI